MKTEAEYFRDWESHVFGYGYGTGEAYVIPVLKTFLEHCNEGYYKHSYQYDVLEKAVTAPVAWLLKEVGKCE